MSQISQKESIHASLTVLTVPKSEQVEVGTLIVEGVSYEYVFDYDAHTVHIDGGIKLGAVYDMQHLALEENAPTRARILARGILHHYKRDAQPTG